MRVQSTIGGGWKDYHCVQWGWPHLVRVQDRRWVGRKLLGVRGNSDGKTANTEELNDKGISRRDKAR